ncbi:hypothetical protein TVAG_343020 [Trichomonas vaginalis G3]|uniref:DUF3447 domain-containing protein n=1 Tax=Trichomonas vaginalis (strain ATCC PRA-98 / G3) TaxID=412133 RepID=A2EJR4_TRIV3|nr:protein of unknown function (DUF3447) [Trichomonas vaginalis G3]EAY07138.1 hypothetical protein TVAG_343020 [Trichomonas vaginalis G3]KAI5522493.1 protein of unknown function (DUF3447) [Trichomonas vaginalis G3]|eukprot:XP_001319361.1 hypothetical protein [Trichomonas vaginalis G3]
MSEQDTHPNEFNELRSKYKYYIDTFNTLYQLKTENIEELYSIYKMIKTELIDSKKYPPQRMIKNILDIIPYNNRYITSYLILAEFITDDYQVTEDSKISIEDGILTYKEYSIDLDYANDFEKIESKDLIFDTENAIYPAIMYNDKESFICLTEMVGFDQKQKLTSNLYPDFCSSFSLLELCCYYGAVDCFKFLRTKFNSKITKTCLQYSFLGGNPDIMSECLKYKKPDWKCMKYATISHNIDFVTFLMNEYNLEINRYTCARNNNLESFLVYFDQTNDVNGCLIYSTRFNIPSLCEYFLSHGANINAKDINGQTALHKAAKKIVK